MVGLLTGAVATALDACGVPLVCCCFVVQQKACADPLSSVYSQGELRPPAVLQMLLRVVSVGTLWNGCVTSCRAEQAYSHLQACPVEPGPTSLLASVHRVRYV